MDKHKKIPTNCIDLIKEDEKNFLKFLVRINSHKLHSDLVL